MDEKECELDQPAAAACFTERNQGVVKERFDRPVPGEHHGAHQAGLAVRPAVATRSSGRIGRANERVVGRNLAKNRFSGSVPPTISALTALTVMCVPTRGRAPADAVHVSLRERVA